MEEIGFVSQLMLYWPWIGGGCCCFLILIIVGGGAAYYFMVHKKKGEASSPPIDNDASSTAGLDTTQDATDDPPPLSLDKTFDIKENEQPQPSILDKQLDPTEDKESGPAITESNLILELPEEDTSPEPEESFKPKAAPVINLGKKEPINQPEEESPAMTDEPPAQEGPPGHTQDDFEHPPLPEVPDFDFASAPTIMPFEDDMEDELPGEGDVGEDDATVLMQRKPPKRPDDE